MKLMLVASMGIMLTAVIAPPALAQVNDDEIQQRATLENAPSHHN